MAAWQDGPLRQAMRALQFALSAPVNPLQPNCAGLVGVVPPTDVLVISQVRQAVVWLPSLPAAPMPATPMPAAPVVPAGPLPAGPLPPGPLPAGPLPAGPLPPGPLPAGPLPAGPLPPTEPPAPV